VLTLDLAISSKVQRTSKLFLSTHQLCHEGDGWERRKLMPLWNVYCTEGTNSSEEKRAFADAIPAHAQRESAQTRSARTVLG
jgi:hypothetical protein